MHMAEELRFYGSTLSAVVSSASRMNSEIHASRLQRRAALESLEARLSDIDEDIKKLDEKSPKYERVKAKLLEIRANLVQTLTNSRGSK